MPEKVEVEVDQYGSVTALAYDASRRGRAQVTLLLGHGAGAGQTSEFMVSFAEGLAGRGIDVVTFNFLYTQEGRRAPDPGGKLEACYRAAIATAGKRKKENRLAIGGKSLGGRIASQVAAGGVENLSGLVFLGYPLHPPGKPDLLRSGHLASTRAPMMFVQGSRDPFGTPDELRPIIKKFDPPATIYTIDGGDHSFKVPKRSGMSREEIHSAAQDEIARWLRDI